MTAGCQPLWHASCTVLRGVVASASCCCEPVGAERRNLGVLARYTLGGLPIGEKNPSCGGRRRWSPPKDDGHMDGGSQSITRRIGEIPNWRDLRPFPALRVLPPSAVARGPCFVATLSTAASSMSHAATVSPDLASINTTDRPIPSPAPVTTATSPLASQGCGTDRLSIVHISSYELVDSNGTRALTSRGPRPYDRSRAQGQ